RNRWAFFARGADCLVLHVTGPAGEPFGDETFVSAARSFEALPLPPDRQREVDLLAGMGFLERRDPGSALERFEALSKREPDLAEGQYNYACALARLGDKQGALDHLKAAVRLDGELVSHAREDDDLKSLRGSPGFEQLLGTAK